MTSVTSVLVFDPVKYDTKSKKIFQPSANRIQIYFYEKLNQYQSWLFYVMRYVKRFTFSNFCIQQIRPKSETKEMAPRH